jgi:Bacterial regulatory proteins, tetR family
VPGGLREQKKAQARAAMALAAADLFGQHGYADVAMAQIARAAGVSEQTFYNYFPTKESLVFDRADRFETRCCRSWPAGSDESGRGVPPVGWPRSWWTTPRRRPRARRRSARR